MARALKLVLADDLTGTLEIGAILKQAGQAVRVGIGDAPAVPQDQALVIDCQTRRMPAAAALMRYSEILKSAGRPAEQVYFKIDSTLRGNVAAALHAALTHFPESRIVFCPAYPAQGRTVRDGQLLVHGEPLGAKTAADQSAEPVGSGIVREVLAALGSRVVSYDAQTEDDLRTIWTAADTSATPVVMVGSAGLLAARYPALVGSQLSTADLSGRKWIVACGSMNPATQSQLRDSPWTVLRSPAPAATAASILESDHGVVLATPPGHDEGDVLAWLLAIIQGTEATGMIVFGGDTAACILAACGVRTLEPAGEILPGVPCSWITLRGARIPLITKAGGFGEPNLLRALISEINKA